MTGTNEGKAPDFLSSSNELGQETKNSTIVSRFNGWLTIDPSMQMTRKNAAELYIGQQKLTEEQKMKVRPDFMSKYRPNQHVDKGEPQYDRSVFESNTYRHSYDLQPRARLLNGQVQVVDPTRAAGHETRLKPVELHASRFLKFDNNNSQSSRRYK